MLYDLGESKGSGFAFSNGTHLVIRKWIAFDEVQDTWPQNMAPWQENTRVKVPVLLNF